MTVMSAMNRRLVALAVGSAVIPPALFAGVLPAVYDLEFGADPVPWIVWIVAVVVVLVLSHLGGFYLQRRWWPSARRQYQQIFVLASASCLLVVMGVHSAPEAVSAATQGDWLGALPTVWMLASYLLLIWALLREGGWRPSGTDGR